jgi:octanoyl-[GcvH]:protein N-octanoyltransferase
VNEVSAGGSTAEGGEGGKPPLALITEGFPDDTAFDTAVSHSLLQRVSDGQLPQTLRIYRPGRIVAFGRQDSVSAGFAEAAEEARQRGFQPVIRLAGGRAAVFHEGTIAFAWAVPTADPKEGVYSRFEEISSMMADALQKLGVDARVGEAPGEYCPGRYSVNARGRVKLIGVGQRLIKHAAHVGGVLVVSGGQLIRDVLIPVYRALQLDWSPATAGDLSAEVAGIGWEVARDAVLAEFGRRFDLRPARLDSETLALAADFPVDPLPAIPRPGPPSGPALG